MNKNGEGGANVKRRLGMAVVLCCLAASVLLLHGCQAGGDGEIEYVIGVSLANMREPWRLVLMDEIQQEAAKHPEVRLVFADATQDAEKQIDDIHRLQNYGIDLLVVSPCDVVQITPVVGEVYRSIPVIVLDRAVEGFDYGRGGHRRRRYLVQQSPGMGDAHRRFRRYQPHGQHHERTAGRHAPADAGRLRDKRSVNIAPTLPTECRGDVVKWANAVGAAGSFWALRCFSTNAPVQFRP